MIITLSTLGIFDDIEQLRPLCEEWKACANSEDFPLHLNVDAALSTMRRLITQPLCDVIVLRTETETVGFMGLSVGQSHIALDLIANECCFFVSQKARGGGVKIIKFAEKLAKGRGCTFLTINASMLAGDAKRSSNLYMRLGYKPLESSHIKAL
jgi:GNAT superfamily N-acetyltransferase